MFIEMILPFLFRLSRGGLKKNRVSNPRNPVFALDDEFI